MKVRSLVMGSAKSVEARCELLITSRISDTGFIGVVGVLRDILKTWSPPATNLRTYRAQLVYAKEHGRTAPVGLMSELYDFYDVPGERLQRMTLTKVSRTTVDVAICRLTTGRLGYEQGPNLSFPLRKSGR